MMRPSAFRVLLFLCLFLSAAGCGPDPPDLTPVHARITEGDACVVAIKKALPRRAYWVAEEKYVELRGKYVQIAEKLEALDLSPEQTTPILAALTAWEQVIAAYRKFRNDFRDRAEAMGDQPFTVESLKRQGLTEDEARRVQKDVREYYRLDKADEHERNWNREELLLDRAMKAVAGLR